MNFIKQLLENFEKEKFIHLLEAIFGVLIQLKMQSPSKYNEGNEYLLCAIGRNINVKVDLSNYATKTDLKNVKHVDTSIFALKTKLGNLKTEFDKLDIDKLAPVPVDMSKLSDLIKNDVAKKTVYDKLTAKVNNIDTSDFVLKNKYQTDKTELEKKSADATDFVKNAELTKVENKIPDISNLATKIALTTVE